MRTFWDEPDRGYEVLPSRGQRLGLAQVTNLATDDAETPSIAADHTTIVFSSDADPWDRTRRIVRDLPHQANGTGSSRSLVHWNRRYQPEISANGAVVTFYTGGGDQIFKVNADGTGLLQLTVGSGSYGQRIDDTGTWIAFHSYGYIDVNGPNPTGSPQIYRIRSDGTGLQRITPDNTRFSFYPDISASGARIVYCSTADPLGTNPSHFFQEFIYETATGVTRQLTFGSGSSWQPTISGDGN